LAQIKPHLPSGEGIETPDNLSFARLRNCIMAAGDRTSCFRALTHLVGNTPLLVIGYRFRGRDQGIYAKPECQSPLQQLKPSFAAEVVSAPSADSLLGVAM
jgi:hypothetical protein